MGNFTDKDKGWKKFMSDMKKNSGETVVMSGYLRSSGDYKPKADEKIKSPISIAQVAMFNEFGTAHAPERSFIRSVMSEQNKKLKAVIKKLAAKVALGRMDKKQALGIVGEFLVTAFKNKIQDGVPPPNAESTVKQKGSDHTLIDQGQMRDTLDWEIQSGKGK